MRFDPPPRLGSPKFSHPSPLPLCPDRCAQWPKFHLIPPRQGPATAAHKVPPAPAPARVALKQPVAGKLGVILERSVNSPRNSRGRKGGALATVRPLFFPGLWNTTMTGVGRPCRRMFKLSKPTPN